MDDKFSIDLPKGAKIVPEKLLEDALILPEDQNKYLNMLTSIRAGQKTAMINYIVELKRVNIIYLIL